MRRRVLVIIQGTVGDRPAGPEIRGWAMAQAFATDHDVTVLADCDRSHVRDGIPIVPRTRRNLVREARRHDVVVGPLLPPYLLLALAARRVVRVADLYDPVDLELSTLGDHWRARRLTAQRRALHRLQLRSADVVVCANEPQRERLMGELAGARGGGAPDVVVAGMGLPDAPGAATGHPLRERFAAIGADDPIVLWWGSVWRWLDAPGAIRAIQRVAQQRPDVRLVITAGPPPNAQTNPLNVTEEARALARELGLLDRHVFFLEEWVPFEARHRYLRDAQVGITLHAEAEEAPLAARSRYMDYIWAGLPSVLARGDVIAAGMEAAGAALVVSPGDPDAAAAAVERLLADDALRASAREACAALAETLRWPAVLAPAVQAAEATAAASGRPRNALSLWRDAATFYGRRALNKCLRVA